MGMGYPLLPVLKPFFVFIKPLPLILGSSGVPLAKPRRVSHTARVASKLVSATVALVTITGTATRVASWGQLFHVRNSK